VNFVAIFVILAARPRVQGAKTGGKDKTFHWLNKIFVAFRQDGFCGVKYLAIGSFSDHNLSADFCYLYLCKDFLGLAITGVIILLKK